MKLSISWVFDHIDADWKQVDIKQLIQKFNQMVAEIESFEKVTIDLKPFTMIEIIRVNADKIIAFSKEWRQECVMLLRKDVQVGQFYLAKRSGDRVEWATGFDLGSGKDMLMPELVCSPAEQDGSWKQSCETDDYIIQLDNKSVTHRPDMWGHRGFAREVAALLDLPFKPLAPFLAEKKVTQYELRVPATATSPVSIENNAPHACKRFAGMYLSNITPQPSLLPMAHRLARVDARAIDAIVDMTNYVMLEIGQPMHAFAGQYRSSHVKVDQTDKGDIQGKRQIDQLIVRMAKDKENLTLLDGTTVALTPDDLVISDGSQALALAGVMGGKDAGVDATTTSIIIESACFDAATIRKTAARYKKRSEASARFEKSLDPNQNIIAIKRFLKLFHDAHMHAVESDEIFSLGQPAQPSTISVAHNLIEQRLGVKLTPESVQKILRTLEFEVTVLDGMYTILVPTFRGTKDVRLQEDIIEEIGRFYGYTTLVPQMPRLPLRPSPDSEWVYRQRTIKQILAHAVQMRELYTYAFFDEEFLQQLSWQPTDTLEVQSPVSENWRRLVTTLVPGLLKAVATCSAEHDTVRFFELARTWHCSPEVTERKSLVSIFFDKKSVDFYHAKAELQKLFDALKLSITWVKSDKACAPWYAPHQTADLICDGRKIGIAASLHPTFLHAVCQGQGFIFELDADFLLHHAMPITHFVPFSKYPEMVRDISMLISVEMTVDQVCHLIAQIDPKIINVSLIDFFEKDEWPGKRAMTCRFVISDHERTMTKEEADHIWDNVAAKLKAVGATIR